MIIVHVFQSIAGCSVVNNYRKLLDMNLGKLKKQQEEQDSEDENNDHQKDDQDEVDDNL